MRGMKTILVAVLVAACARAAPAPMPDAQCVFGEACSASSTTTATECLGGLGWCIDNVCRPRCIQPTECVSCYGGVKTFGSKGECYCAPE